ncbi:Similar to TTLL3A: Tubulin glycylase 3A (Drosophila melanogaster) [Cotesia congregata]|uniref:Similar to TTLL3A: Tubulin glycylase 3A (Drosophila melanogaster) n=1 Tax=Cotesia congregata TaxID=51543 RepID=A0A8J2HI60_COTCN|nr:Similar to TTLL3A: Tubulin glycylase 3A (Drosophila melanogaster) [Cotesia congregata]
MRLPVRDDISDIKQEKEEETVENNQDVTEPVTSDVLLDIDSVPLTLYERFLSVKQIVKDAIAAHHTFMIYGRAKVIRECLLKRGWVEKFYRRNSNGERSRNQHSVVKTHHRLRVRNVLGDQQFDQKQQPRIQSQTQQHAGADSSPVVLLSGIGDLKDEQSKQLLISKMLVNHTVDFLWNSGSDWSGWPSQNNKTTIFNRYSRAGFTSKVGLCSNVRQMHWYYEPGIANTLFPRCYNICQADHLHAFIEDFRLTACVSLLKWFVEKMDNQTESREMPSTVPLKALDFAIRRCSDFIAAQSHEDIDKESERVWSHQWDQFICWYYKIVQNEAFFLGTDIAFQKYILAAKHILKRMRKYWQQLDMDGVLSIWILKPGNRSRGRGIVLMNKIEDIIAKISPANKSDTRYVVQKYIERPLLIYNTKFDIRQWFIVTCAQPLTLWMYRESYLRFCSQKFRLNDLHESIHLNNHAVQCKYRNSPDRDTALPNDNMWDATTFKKFLNSQGHSSAWDELIYPGMKQSLVGSLLASQEAMDRRKNSFELYGADFMVMEDFSVWLIEINSHPDMSYSTTVTTRLCKQVMEDLIKVIIDFRENKNANTGLFELVYKQRMPNCQPYLGTALSVQGTSINTNEKKLNNPDSKIIPKLPLSCISRKKSTANNYIGPVIIDLIEELEIQIDRELHSYYKENSLNDSNFSSPILTSPITSSSQNSLALAPVHVEGGPSLKDSISFTSSGISSKKLSPIRSTQKTKRNTQSGHSSQKLFMNNDSIKKYCSKQKTSKVTNNHRQIAKTAGKLKSEKYAKKKNEDEKLMGKAVRSAINKCKKYEIISLDVPPLPSLTTPRKSGNRVSRSFVNSKIKDNFYIQKKQEALAITEICAKGLSLTK